MEWKKLSGLEKFNLILPYIEQGKSNIAIGKEFGINESTVRDVIKKNGYKRDSKNNRKLLKLNDVLEKKESKNKCITSDIHKKNNVKTKCTIDVVQKDNAINSEHYTGDIQLNNVRNSECITGDIQIVQDSNTTVLMDVIDIKDLKEIISMKEDLKDIIQAYSNSIANGKVIDVEPMEIKLDKSIGAVGKAVGMRIDEEVYKEWQQFTGRHKDRFKTHQLLSQALLEFMDKYK